MAELPVIMAEGVLLGVSVLIFELTVLFFAEDGVRVAIGVPGKVLAGGVPLRPG